MMADAGQGGVEAVAQAVMMLLDHRSSQQARQSASDFLKSLETAEVHLVASTAFALTRSGQALEIRHQGFKMLQHLVRCRWEQLSTQERMQMGAAVLQMMEDMAKPEELWNFKSQYASLVAEVARKEGPDIWSNMFRTLHDLSTRGPVHAELVAMVLRWFPEDVAFFTDDLDGIRRRLLIKGLTTCLPETLALLYKILGQECSAAMAQVQQNQLDLAKRHGAAVTACLQAAKCYAEWAPVEDLAKSGLIEACGYLLAAAEFCLTACEFMKHLSSRRRPADAGPDFDSSMVQVFDALVKASGSVLGDPNDIGVSQEGSSQSEPDYMDCLCETMAAFGTHHLVCLKGKDLKISTYLAQMLGFMQHPKFSVHSQALPLWLMLLRDSSTAGAVEGKDAKASLFVIPEVYYVSLLEISFQRLSKTNADRTNTGSLVEEVSPELFASRNDYGHYRSQLVLLVRLISSRSPLLSAVKMAQCVYTVVGLFSLTSWSDKDLAVLEGAHVMLETVVYSIPETPLKLSTSKLHDDAGRILEDLLQKLLTMRPADPPLLEMYGRYFAAMGPYLKYSPTSTSLVIQKLFEVLMLICSTEATMARQYSRVRIRVCTSILRFAKSAGSALLPHMQAFAGTMTSLRQQGLISRGELNLLGEALLCAGLTAGVEEEKQVFEWLLGPLRETWVQQEWQERYLSSPASLVSLLLQNDSNKSEGQLWSIFHSVNFFDKALRRCTSRRRGVRENLGTSLLQWILPPLLELLRCVHALWAQDTDTAPFIHIRAALGMGAAQQATLLGDPAAHSWSTSSSREVDSMETSSSLENKTGMEDKENEIRNWLRGVRESGYNILSRAASRIPVEFFNDADQRAAALSRALTESLAYMEFHHCRQLLHTVMVPMVAACPSAKWDPWMVTLLPPIFLCCQAHLSRSWREFMETGIMKIPGKWLEAAGSDGSVDAAAMEVIAEKMLRDLSREVCGLLRLTATPTGESRSLTEVPVSAAKETKETLLRCMLKSGGAAARAALSIAAEALTWPDQDSVKKAADFSSEVANLAGVVDGELKAMVSRDMFTAALQGLSRESNATLQSNLLGVVRDFLVNYPSADSAPWQVLSTLPEFRQDYTDSLRQQLAQSRGLKEEKACIKAFLLTAGGSYLKALPTPPRSSTTVSNLSSKPMSGSCLQVSQLGWYRPSLMVFPPWMGCRSSGPSAHSN